MVDLVNGVEMSPICSGTSCSAVPVATPSDWRVVVWIPSVQMPYANGKENENGWEYGSPIGPHHYIHVQHTTTSNLTTPGTSHHTIPGTHHNGLWLQMQHNKQGQIYSSYIYVYKPSRICNKIQTELSSMWNKLSRNIYVRYSVLTHVFSWLCGAVLRTRPIPIHCQPNT